MTDQESEHGSAELTDPDPGLEEYLRVATQKPDKDRDYYALTISANKSGGFEYSLQTHWVGFTDETPPREIREASIMHPDRMLERWRKLGEPGIVINSVDDFFIFFVVGGHAVVDKAVAEECVPEWLKPRVALNVGSHGFASPGLLGAGALRRAPMPKLRMRILLRDGLRCRLCGRSPNDHVDIELHVHHIRPWASGGVTEESNLITLCHTCHAGLDPHFHYDLFELVHKRQSVEDRTEEYAAMLMRYSKEAAAQFERVAVKASLRGKRKKGQ